MKLLTSIIFYVFGLGSTAFSQSEDFQKAIKLVQDEEYNKATPIFESLIERYEKEPVYHYYLGKCYTQTFRKTNQAIESLQLAAAKASFTDTYYYLAKAYVTNFDYTSAKIAIDKYLIFATTSDKRNIDHEKLLKDITYNQTMVLDAVTCELNGQPVVISNLINNLNSILSVGKYAEAPSETQHFLSNKTPWGEIAYQVDHSIYTTAFNLRSRSQDIIVRSDIDDRSEILSDMVNSRGNEIIPYFHSPTNTLYFASNGHANMGGYDIYKSAYNPIENSWSKAEALKFPINAVSDEIAYIPLTKNTAILVSNRNGGVYKLFKLTIKGETINFKLLPNKDKIALLNLHAELSGDYITTTETLPVHEKEKVKENTPSTNDNILNQALTYQLKADSLLRQAEKKRALTHSGNPLPSGIYTEIEQDEKEALHYQQLADEKFKQLQSTNTRQKVHKESKKQTSLMSLPSKKDKAPQKESEFKLLSKSPYNSQKPFRKHDDLPVSLLYKVQLGVFSQKAAFDKFGGLTPISVEYIAEKQLNKYYCGEFISYQDASKALEIIKHNGFTDAYIIAFYEKKKIPVSRAKDIEAH